jgi:hypothetical protein
MIRGRVRVARAHTEEVIMGYGDATIIVAVLLGTTLYEIGLFDWLITRIRRNK